jgi:hypothetical protein
MSVGCIVANGSQGDSGDQLATQSLVERRPFADTGPALISGKTSALIVVRKDGWRERGQQSKGEQSSIRAILRETHFDRER